MTDEMFEYTIKKYGFTHKTIWYADTIEDGRKYGADAVSYYYPLAPLPKGWRQTTSKIQCIDISAPLDAVFCNFNPNTRREIRRMEKLSPIVRFNADSDYEAFCLLMNSMTKIRKLHLPDFFKVNLRQQDHLLVSVSVKQYKMPLALDYFGIQGNSLYVNFITNAKYWVEETVDARLISRASRLSVWETIKWGKAREFREVTLGGLSPDDPKHDSFKEGFGGHDKEIIGYQRIFNPLLKLALTIKKSKYQS